VLQRGILLFCLGCFPDSQVPAHQDDALESVFCFPSPSKQWKKTTGNTLSGISWNFFVFAFTFDSGGWEKSRY
jgi:hypothetical protein